MSYDPLNELESVLKVVIPDETNGSVFTKTLPVRPHMTARDVCKIIARKLRITNPEDYYLFTLIARQGENNSIILRITCCFFLYLLNILLFTYFITVSSANYLYFVCFFIERLLLETQHPQDIKRSTIARGSYCLFVYKKNDAK